MFIDLIRYFVLIKIFSYTFSCFVVDVTARNNALTYFVIHRTYLDFRHYTLEQDWESNLLPSSACDIITGHPSAAWAILLTSKSGSTLLQYH